MSNYTVLKEGIREYKNFITAQEAAELVAYFDAAKSGDSDIINLNKISPLPPVVETIHARALAEVRDLSGENDLDSRILAVHKHPVGSLLKPQDFHHFSFVIHLNDEYQGGEFIIPSQNIAMKPEALSMILFKAGNAHGVGTVTEGDRYSMSGAVRIAGVV